MITVVVVAALFTTGFVLVGKQINDTVYEPSLHRICNVTITNCSFDECQQCTITISRFGENISALDMECYTPECMKQCSTDKCLPNDEARTLLFICIFFCIVGIGFVLWGCTHFAFCKSICRT